MSAPTLDKMNADGEGLIYYPSGRVAVMVSKDRGLKVTTVMADSTSGQVLLSFNHLGVGTVEYPNGKPWLVVTEEGWSVSDRRGAIVERGKFPRKQTQPIRCEVNENLVVTFQDRQNITASFSCEDVIKTLECGEKLRRTEPYTNKVTSRRPNGKLELDVDAIRQRQRDVEASGGLSGSLYVPPGPHRFQTEHPGLGALKTTLQSLPTSSPVTETVRDLQALDGRLDTVDLLPKPMYGSAAAGSLTGTSQSLRGTRGASGGGDGSPSSTRRGTATLASGMPEDWGSPSLTPAMQKLAGSIRPLDLNKQRHRPGRLKLASLAMAAVQSRLMDALEAPKDELQVVVLLADWSPVCSRLEAAAQTANRELVDEGTANPASSSGHVKVYKVDASEGSLLQKKYSFRTVPMFLMFFEGKLVEATNNLRTAQEIKASCLDALTRARKGMTLPEGFSFSAGRDNQQLDFITPTWSPLVAAQAEAASA